ncbi:MAG: hypothetical protein DRO87_03800 [Candidatus Thorarchaeota archaeon]|nr:MAG: hypothetical protein DRO87_03800 [Candidatus Thorarchaeota archaeon]
MPKKNERSITSALGGGESVRMLRKALRKTLKPADDKLEKMLESITSIQACRDAALTGNEDLRLLAVCRLGEFGVDGLESLDIALNDDSPLVRAVAAGMIAVTRSRDGAVLLESYSNDNSEIVRAAIEFSTGWLQENGHNLLESSKPVKTESLLAFLLEDSETPLKTSDDVVVTNEFATIAGSLEFGITVQNIGTTAVHDVTVQVLSFPRENMNAEDELEQNIDVIEPGDAESLIFGFSVTGDVVEGEIITSVTFYDQSEQLLAAKSGNVFVRALYEQMVPLEADKDEFLELKKGMKAWNREHMLAAEAKVVYESAIKMIEDKNLKILQTESTERKGAFMGVVSGMGQNRMTGNRLAVIFTVLGKADDDLSKMRIDVFSDNPEILHSAASDLFESVQRSLGIIEE